MGIVDENCERFLDTVLPPGFSENQRESMHMAFYAGHKSLLMVIRTVAMENYEVGEAILNMVEQEIDGFINKVKNAAAAQRAEAEGKSDAGG